MNSFEFASTKRIICEPGATSKLAEMCHDLGIKRPFIVSDQGVAACGLVDQVYESLSQANLDYGVFLDVVADPPEDVIEQAVDVALAHQADGIIGFGGGSSLDTAKLVALLHNGACKLNDVYGVDQVHVPRLPLVLVPTTAGTGSEVTPISIVTRDATTKSAVVSSTLLPDIAVLDASLTLALPPEITAATGIDAMVHAIEAFTSKRLKNPYSDMLAFKALGLLSGNIIAATLEAPCLKVRQAMLLGSCLAGQAFANAPVGGVHALAYPLGGQFHIAHGLSNALVLSHVMRFNLPEAQQEYQALCSVIDFGGHFNDKYTKHTLPEQLIENFENLQQLLNMPTRLQDLGINSSALESLAQDAMKQTRLLANNPRVIHYEDAFDIYKQAF